MNCPVCESIGEEQMLLSQGVVLTALQALVAGDVQTLRDIQSTATPEDFHAALGVIVAALTALEMTVGLDIQSFISMNRKILNVQIARLGGENPNSSGPDGPNQPVRT